VDYEEAIRFVMNYVDKKEKNDNMNYSQPFTA